MNVPRAWTKAEGKTETPEGEPRALLAWGWGDDEPHARELARERLQRLLERVRSGKSRPEEYDYAARPLREEILQVVGPTAVVTRNRYGAVVLNASRLLFLDVDLPEGPGVLARLFGRRKGAKDPLESLRSRLRETGGTFRLYRTAAGLRVIAIDREHDPRSAEVQRLMELTGTDEALARLCRAQGSFRARLTPKPWRCDCPRPPGDHPRTDPEAMAAFAEWHASYADAIEGYATCRYLEVVGSGAVAPALAPLVELHDSATRCSTELPLA